ncbi:MAG TPA: alkaline phosphatase family protein [Thermoanaerobaculia bacterium]
METGNGHRVLMIGLDSADYDYLEPRLSSLPSLRRLIGKGIVRRLDTPASVMSASVWPTFFTGSLPGDHGQYFPIQWDPAKMELRHGGEWLNCEPFWRPLAREGLAVTTLDVQMAFPSRTQHGIEVVNWGSNTLGPFHCNRPVVEREIERQFGAHVLQPDIPVEKSPERFAAIRKGLLAGAKRRGDLCRWLLKRAPWDLAVVVFQECHRAGHYFWKGGAPGAAGASGASGDPDDEDAMLEAYRAVDREVGEIVAEAGRGETSVIVFSLLGMGENRAQMHLVPRVIDRINARFLSRDGGVAPAQVRAPKRSLMGMLRDRLPAVVQERLALLVPASVRDWVVAHAYAGALDWPRTPGFALPTGGEGYIRVNLAGREAGGWIERGSAEHRRYLSDVEDGFRSLRRAGTDEPLVDEVTLLAERFPGPRSDYLPDLAISWRSGGPATEVHSDRLGDFSGRLKTGRGGNHRGVAFAAVAGPAARSRQAQSMTSIVDLAHFVRDLSIDRSAPA